MTIDTHGGDTRRRLLEVACRLFAERGYRNTSVAQICRDAGANIAAVNYHFGGKARLYREAWRHAHQELLRRAPPDGRVPPDRPASERLRGRIQAALQRILAFDAAEHGILRHEMVAPTGLLREVIDEAVRPLREAIQGILRELLGPRATAFEVELCELCVVAPWMHLCRRCDEARQQGLVPLFREEMIDAMTDSLTAYARAGIREIRRRLERRSGPVNGGKGRRRTHRCPASAGPPSRPSRQGKVS